MRRQESGCRTGRQQCLPVGLVKRQRLFYGTAALALFAIEVCIALFADGFVRNSLGDVLAVLLLHCALRVLFPGKPRALPRYVFLFACAIEAGQYFCLFDSLPRVLRIILGGVFDWGDILCYFAGCAVAALLEYFYHAYRKNHLQR